MTDRATNLWAIVLFAVVLVRIFSLGSYPLTDTTEARYGEVSRVMVTSGNWITPQLELGVPFWAKPPLSFWQNAASMAVFGVSEFSARLPALMNMLLVLVMMYFLARRYTTREVGVMSLFIALTTVLGFVASGAVMTDAAMLLSTTLAMVSFWLAMEQDDKRWGYVFVVALALGLLAKGLIAWVLTGVPLVVWLTLVGKWRTVFRVIPVVEGTAILGLVALPWFLLAEIETPGFLHYFFIGEHLQRYLDSGWAGDRYGTAHDEPRGMIWVFWLIAFAPWSIVAASMVLLRILRSGTGVFSGISHMQYYLLLWCLWPAVFFSFAGNILPTYVLPGLPAFALLLATGLQSMRFKIGLVAPALVLPVTVMLAGPLGLLDRLEDKSQSSLLATVRAEHPELPIIYVGAAPHSSRFYSRGTAIYPKSAGEFDLLLASNEKALIVARDGHLSSDQEGVNTFAPIFKQPKYTAYLYTNLVTQNTSVD